MDINGPKPPNQAGVDDFKFWIGKNGVIPRGTAKDTEVTFSDNCLAPGATGWGCTAWVIYNENMDYLHCSDLSWDGKKSCKN